MCRYQDAHKGIRSTYPRRVRFAVDIRLKAIAQKASVTLVDLDEAIDSRISIGKRFDCDALRGYRTGRGLCVIDQISPGKPLIHHTRIPSAA